jgi:dephospho-CoA kinase
VTPEIRNPKSKNRNRKPVLALVGGIGSGKSTVARLLGKRGGLVIEADPIAHEALRDPQVRERIVDRFGREVLEAGGEIDRRKLGARVFADASARRELESWVHPWVGERVKERCRDADADASVKFVVLDAPVLLEAGWNDVYDRLIYVDTPRDVQLARLGPRGWTAEQLQARERAQLSLEEKARRADATIENGGTIEETERQVNELLKRWNM